MLEIYKRIKQLRKEQGMTQGELAEKTGYNDRSSIARIEKGEIDISQTKIKAFAKALNTTVGYLLDGVYNYDADNTVPEGFEPIDAVPAVGCIACGKPIEATQEYAGMVACPESIHADFALLCCGDSMAPTIQDGEYVILRKQPDVENGQIAAVLIEGEATLKRVYHEGGSITLVADNHKYAPIHVGKKDVIIQGLAVSVQRSLL